MDTAPLVADGSVAPVIAWYAPDRLARPLAWRRPDHLRDELRDLPPPPFWLVAAAGRLGPGVEDGLAASGLAVDGRAAAEGVEAWRIVAAR